MKIGSKSPALRGARSRGAYARLRYLNKPVDLVLINNDEHELTNPATRLEMSKIQRNGITRRNFPVFHELPRTFPDNFRVADNTSRTPLTPRKPIRDSDRFGLALGRTYLDNRQYFIVDKHSMAKPNDLVQGTLDLLILKTVSLEPKHGWAIAKRIQQISGEVLQVQQGSLYPALHRLEQQGWIKAKWKETETGRQAKFYSLTAAGRAQLEKEAANWSRLSAAINLVVQTT